MYAHIYLKYLDMPCMVKTISISVYKNNQMKEHIVAYSLNMSQILVLSPQNRLVPNTIYMSEYILEKKCIL